MKYQMRYPVAVLCYSHNRATDPRAFRSDHEHKRRSQEARAIRNRLSRLGFQMGVDYRETDDGAYIAIREES